LPREPEILDTSRVKKLLRKSFPRVRVVIIKGVERYQTDSRRKGGGTRETFSTAVEAIERAQKIAEEFEEHGSSAILPFQLRAMALRCSEHLGKFGKSLEDATGFYIKHLEEEAKRANSATISALADQWLADKKSNKKRTLRADTIDDIKETSNLLKKLFPSAKIAEANQKQIETYLDGLLVTHRRKFNLKNRLGQFFNWARKKGYTAFNPCEGIEIVVPSSDPQFLSVEDCKTLLELCERPAHEDLLCYIAICLFAGLRPTECALLRWEQIDFEERQITVLGSTSKVKESRTVTIEPTLARWLTPRAKKSGFVTEPKNFRPRFEKLKVASGYKIGKENPDGRVWIDDGMRHSFATFWLARHNDRPHLAEQMGTGLKMIKKHYKGTVARSKMEAFWNLLPQGVKKAEEEEVKSILKAA